ncbi:glycoside hydrolase family 88 protein [Paenibacillus sp.]|uniref:glycoside hydrolase family 88/105 protein n=1 Tax=Paenibacillus sp. TaxID=58172 RepID=UPI002811EC56|nr:glycoside hydrolase family 88 protein [Paenibacillus sp.]
MNTEERAALALRAPLDYAKAACDSLMKTFAPEALPPAGRWHYHQGIFLQGMLQVWKRAGNDSYFEYPKRYVDHLVDEDGNLLFARDELDSIMPGLLLLALDEHTGDRRYRMAADKLRGLFRTLNATSEGAYWHKDKYPYQMWLDGLYMGGVFALQYAAKYGEPELVPMVLEWEKLMRRHMSDEATGLLYHAWDESRKAPWSDPDTGNSPEFWGRSLGWYGMALADFLDALPAEHPGRPEIAAALGRFVDGLVRFQDESGLWYQVVDKGDRADNWLETSCTSLFVYAIAGAARHGCAGEERLEAARRGYRGLIERLRTDGEGRLVVPDICIGTSAGDYRNYVTRPVSDNDLHGVGAFVLACVAMEALGER